MARFIFFALIAVVAWLLWRHLVSRRRGAPSADPAGTATGARPTASQMVVCAHCGVHLPQQDALQTQGPQGPQHYCCAEHQQRGPRSG